MNIADKDDFMTSYQAVQIEVPIARKQGMTIEVKDAVLINVGLSFIQYKEAMQWSSHRHNHT